ncbi:MAG: UDP-4-amino-4,6-dideoxy-N-acetyl-beta-L-altrosamine transaminase [Algiphilus sp.]|nr:UDP-4-amino-4,6-dideoxy-N-acetyl-beta-L-altrosamine transaminase [Algiphilus sp.]
MVDVLRSDFLTQGPVVPRFEAAVAAYCGANHGVAVNSATSALHLACRAIGLGPGDWLWTSPITFVASANCALYCGAQVDFVDIDPNTFNMCPQQLEKKLAMADSQGRLPKVVVPVHLAGQSCNMKPIKALADRYGFHIVEDASHAIGGRYRDEPVGNCRYSDITVFSFHPVKIITTGEGGLAVTNSEALAERMALLRSHGITREPDRMTHTPDGPWYYQQIDLGYNYRMTEMQAALGLSQLERLDAFVARRSELAEGYDTALADLPLHLPGRCENAESSWHLYVIQVGDSNRHREVFEALRERGIGVNLHYIPVHLQPYYRSLGFSPGDFPVAEDYYSRAISIPLFAGLTNEEQRKVVVASRDALH